MNVTEYPDSEMMAMDLANILSDDLSEALQHEDRACLAVAGGTTPGPIFDSLCAADIDWEDVDVMPTDERWVPEDNPRSNAGMIKRRLLVGRASAARFLPLYAPGHDIAEVLPELEAMIAPELPIAVALMGMGADMHTASIFPEAPGTKQALAPDAPVLVPVHPKDQPEARVTLSARVLDGALRKHLVIVGDAKRRALENALLLPPERAPVQAIMHGMSVHWAPE